MKNLITTLLLLAGGYLLYYGYFEMFFKKRRVLKIENKIKTWFNILPLETSFYGNEDIVENTSKIIKLYEECHFSEEQIDLKIEIACLVFEYLMLSHSVSNHEGSIATASSDNDTSDSEDRLTISSRRKEQLEIALTSLFKYINDKNGDEE